MELTVYEFLTFHRTDRAAYDHLLSQAAGRQSARDAVALLMWLYRSAYTLQDAASRVPATILNPAVAARLVSEAHAALGGPDVAGAEAPPETIASLCGAYAARVRGVLAATPAAALRRGVDEVIASVGPLLFNDHLNGLMRGYEAGGRRGPLPQALAATYVSYRPSGETLQQYNSRSLFITFAQGEEQLFTNREIFECCIATWGRGWVETVKTEAILVGGQLAPLSYSRIVFYSADAVAMIVGDQVNLVINGRQLLVRRSLPQPPPQQQ